MNRLKYHGVPGVFKGVGGNNRLLTGLIIWDLGVMGVKVLSDCGVYNILVGVWKTSFDMMS